MLRARLAYRQLTRFLRATQSPDYLTAKAADIGDFSRLAILLGAAFLTAVILWDYAIDPDNAFSAVWIRILETISMLVWAWAIGFGVHSKASRIAALAVPLFVEISFLQILSMLTNGAAYGAGGILFGYLFGPFLVLSQPFGFAVLVLSLPAIFPLLAAMTSLDFGIEWRVFIAYVWMGFVPMVFILLFFEYLYWNVFSYRRQVEAQALTDGLTQIPNRRYFLGEGARHLARHYRNRDPAGLLFIDVDHFKSINDSFGHHVGDAAIRHVVATLSPMLRESDLIARYGGEEFVVFLQETGTKDALTIAERMRGEMASHPFVADLAHAPEIRLTVSIGVAVYKSRRRPDIDQLINDADKAVYEAKRRGRNQVVDHDEMMAASNPSSELV